MRQLTLSVLIGLAILLQYRLSPHSVLAEVKEDYRLLGALKSTSKEILFYADDFGEEGVIAASYDFGAYADGFVIIGVHRPSWNKMTRYSKKMAIAHEYGHSEFGMWHCTQEDCIMSQGDSYKKNFDYQCLIENARFHKSSHYQYERTETAYRELMKAVYEEKIKRKNYE